MSTLANQRITSSEGLIKHIMAHEAHKGIDDRLLALRIEDNAVNAKTIYDGNIRHCQTLSAKRLSVDGPPPAGMQRNVSFDDKFAHRFVVKGTNSKSNTSTSIASGSRNKSSASSLKKSSGEIKGSTSRSPFPSRKSSSKNSQHSVHSRKSSHCDIIIENEVMKNENEEWGEITEPLHRRNILLSELQKEIM